MAGPPPSRSCPQPKPQIMHGGLFSEDGVTLDDIRKIERNRQPPDSGDWMGQVIAPPPPRPRGSSVSPAERNLLGSDLSCRDQGPALADIRALGQDGKAGPRFP